MHRSCHMASLMRIDAKRVPSAALDPLGAATTSSSVGSTLGGHIMYWIIPYVVRSCGFDTIAPAKPFVREKP